MTKLLPYTFAHPQYFWLLLAVPLFAYWWYHKRNSFYPNFNIPQHGGVLTQPVSQKVKLLSLLPVLKT